MIFAKKARGTGAIIRKTYPAVPGCALFCRSGRFPPDTVYFPLIALYSFLIALVFGEICHPAVGAGIVFVAGNGFQQQFKVAFQAAFSVGHKAQGDEDF